MRRFLSRCFANKKVRNWLIAFLYLLDDIIIAVAILLILIYFHIDITPLLVIFIVVFFAAYVWLTHSYLIPALQRKAVTGKEGMVGQEGKVVVDIAPEGQVSINGEYWQAKSEGETIVIGESVRVVRVEGLTLIVKRKI
jgi:membrane protein implicated in regulation of membrane protease activity